MNPVESKAPPTPRRRSRATLKRWTPRNIARGLLVVAALFALLEIYRQVHIQFAFSSASSGEYSEALETLSSTGTPWLRRGSIRELETEARFHLEIERGLQALENENWFPANTALTNLASYPALLERDPGTITPLLEAWDRTFQAQLESDRELEAQEALDTLLTIEFESAEVDAQLTLVARRAATSLVRHFSQKEAWTAALAEIERARSLGAPPGRLATLGEEIQKRLVTAIEQAARKEEYTRAEALSRIHREAFGTGQEEAPPSIEKIQIQQTIERADGMVEAERFDEALETYDRALILSEGDSLVFERIRDLRERLQDYRKIKGHWVAGTRTTASSLDLDVVRQQRTWSSELIRDRNLVRALVPRKVRVGEYHLEGQVMVKKVDQPEREWALSFEFVNKGRSAEKSSAGFDLGVATVDSRGQVIATRRVSIPFLLAGSTHQVEVRIPRSDRDTSVKYGKIQTP